MYRGIHILGGDLPRRLVEREIYGLRFVLPNGSAPEFSSERLIGITTNRAAFDHYLARRAERAGVHLVEGLPVEDVVIESDRVCALTEDGDEYQSEFLVGADGVNSVVSRSLGLRPQRKDLTRVGLGMEADFAVGEPRVKEACDGRADILQIYPQSGKVSYGWVFPKQEHLGIGIAGAGVHMKRLRPDFDGFVEGLEQRFGFELTPEKRRTYFLGGDGLNSKNVTDRCILVGDAAGFVDPMMGEGIAYAMRSGRFAAEVISDLLRKGRSAEQHLRRYQEKCRKAFSSDFEMARWAALKGTSFADSVLRQAAKLNLSCEIMAMLARGEIGYSDIPATVLRKLPTEIPHLIRDLVYDRVRS
jgi:flavin-dependent dehydrogenase